MADLQFTTVLKEKEVKVTGDDGIVKVYHLRELNGAQRAKYNDSYAFDVSYEDGKVKATADDFKVMSEVDFLSMCFYDDENKLVKKEVIQGYPATMLGGLHKAAVKLSALDQKSIDQAKND